MNYLDTVNTFLTLFKSVETMDILLKSMALALPLLLLVIAWRLPALLQVKVEKMKAQNERIKIEGNVEKNKPNIEIN